MPIKKLYFCICKLLFSKTMRTSGRRRLL